MKSKKFRLISDKLYGRTGKGLCGTALPKASALSPLSIFYFTFLSSA